MFKKAKTERNSYQNIAKNRYSNDDIREGCVDGLLQQYTAGKGMLMFVRN